MSSHGVGFWVERGQAIAHENEYDLIDGVPYYSTSVTLSTYGNNTLFTYKLMAGVSYALTDAWRLLLGYRFMGMGEQDYETGEIPLRGDSIQTHAIQVGVQFYF